MLHLARQVVYGLSLCRVKSQLTSLLLPGWPQHELHACPQACPQGCSASCCRYCPLKAYKHTVRHLPATFESGDAGFSWVWVLLGGPAKGLGEFLSDHHCTTDRSQGLCSRKLDSAAAHKLYLPMPLCSLVSVAGHRLFARACATQTPFPHHTFPPAIYGHPNSNCYNLQ